MFAIVALISGTILPYFTLSYAADTGKSVYLPGPEDERLPDEDGHAFRIVKPRPKSRKLTLRTTWTLSLALYCIQAVILTFFVRTTTQAIILLASIGIPWSVAQWVPFALVMESVREAEAGLSPFEFEGDWFAPERVRGRRESSSASAFARARAQEAVANCEPLSSTASSTANKKQLQQPRQPSTFLARGTEVARESLHGSPSRQPSMGVPVPVVNQTVDEMSLGGTVLGIHNMAIVTPQLIFALIASIVLEKGATMSSLQDATGEMTRSVSVVQVIRLGGVAALFAAILTRFVPLTRIERQRRGINLMNPEPRYDDEVTEDEEEAEEEEARA
jgi:solute carrier family 45 protein 1/2/4